MCPTFLAVGANNVKLGDIKLGNVIGGNNTLQFLNQYGATAKVTAEMIGAAAFEKFGAVDAIFTFATEEEASSYDLPGGWHLPDDWNGDGEFPMNDIKLPAGKAFVIKANDAGMTITLPSALKPVAK